MFRYTIVVVFATLVNAQYNMVYNEMSVTYDGSKCMNNCVNNYCITRFLDQTPMINSCYSTRTVAPVYYTAQIRGNITQCLSRCGHFGLGFEWCFTSFYSWDYCSSTVDQPTMTVAPPVSKQCVQPCGYFGRSYKWCYTSSKNWDYCETVIIQSGQGKRTKCMGPCGYYYGQSLKLCYTYHNTWAHCSAVIVQHTEMLYTKTSKTLDGSMCMNNCVNNKCVTTISFDGQNAISKPCQSLNTPAPVYYTVQKRGKRRQCLSRCGDFGRNFEWCFTTNNYNWDFCHSVIVQSYNMLHNTISVPTDGSECMNNCVNNKCVTGFQGKKAIIKYCQNTHEAAPVYHTTQQRGSNTQCLSRCGYFGRNVEWCLTTNNYDWDYCHSTNVQSNGMLYNTTAKTDFGHECMNNCVNNKCVTALGFKGENIITKSCQNTTKAAPVYYTSQKRGKEQYCLSRCGRFGQRFDWCFVSNNYDWDYCSSTLSTKDSPVTRKQFTYNLLPCTDKCERSRDGRYRCKSITGFNETCNRKGVSYMKAKTVYGLNCLSTCWKHRKSSHFWCYDENRRNEYCALPARPRLL